MSGQARRSPPIRAMRIAPLILLAGCDPILSIDGAFFPAWLLCMIGGGFMLGGIRWLVLRLGMEPFVGPKVPVYFCTYLACTLGLWLGFFHR
ncbi:MAG: hypothetical protein RLZZ558_1577 [Planctomycetota bacterium]|jgi:hypothetical protein